MPGEKDQLPELVKVQVTGASSETWGRLRAKLIESIGRLLDAVIDEQTGTTVREEAKDFTSKALQSLKSRLERPTLENDKIVAEITKALAEAEALRASAAHQNAQAESVRFEIAVKRMRLVIAGAKAMVIGDGSEEAVVFGQQLSAWEQALSGLENAGRALPER